MGTTAFCLGMKPGAPGLLTDQLESSQKDFRGNDTVKTQHIQGEQSSWRCRERDVKDGLAQATLCYHHAHTMSGC